MSINKMNNKTVSALAIVLILCLTVVFSMPSAAYGETKAKAPAAPRITTCKASGNEVTLKWSRIKGADFYKVYLRTITKEWKFFKTVKKTKANKRKYSDTSKYKIKLTKDGKKYRIYKKTSVKHYKLLKKLTKRTYTYKGKYNKKYTFTVKAHKGKKYSKYSKVKTVRTEKKPKVPDQKDDITDPADEPVVEPIIPDVPMDDEDNWDREKEKAYVNTLTGELADTTGEVRKTSLKLFKEIAEEDVKAGKNTMVSPVSFLTAMGMLQDGAKGETLSEIQSAFGMNRDNFGRWFTEWYGLSQLKGKSTLKLADSVWYRNTDAYLDVKETYIEKVRDTYGAEINGEPFDGSTVKKINDWVSKNTDNMIPSIIDQLTPDAMMALINATCFTGKWEDPYEESQVKKDQDFTHEDGKTVDKVEMMSSSESGYFENDLLTGTFKYYRKGYKIMFLLPKEGESVEKVLDCLDGDALYELEKNAIHKETHLYLPKFSFDYTAPDCIGSLRNMGIQKTFDPELADLSEMATYDIPGHNLYVSDIIHKTHIDLNEKGTDAAAATAILVKEAGAAYDPEGPKKVCLNRPFIFVISDNATSTPIFMGTVYEIH